MRLAHDGFAVTCADRTVVFPECSQASPSGAVPTGLPTLKTRVRFPHRHRHRFHFSRKLVRTALPAELQCCSPARSPGHRH